MRRKFRPADQQLAGPIEVDAPSRHEQRRRSGAGRALPPAGPFEAAADTFLLQAEEEVFNDLVLLGSIAGERGFQLRKTLGKLLATRARRGIAEGYPPGGTARNVRVVVKTSDSAVSIRLSSHGRVARLRVLGTRMIVRPDFTGKHAVGRHPVSSS